MTRRSSFARSRQCSGCPWKKTVDPTDIPNGYDPDRQRKLAVTDGGGLDAFVEAVTTGIMKVMACHESAVGKEYACVGWLWNQLGVGNNLFLRLRAARGEIPQNLRVYGAQYASVDEMCASAPKCR